MRCVVLSLNRINLKESAQTSCTVCHQSEPYNNKTIESNKGQPKYKWGRKSAFLRFIRYRSLHNELKHQLQSTPSNTVPNTLVKINIEVKCALRVTSAHIEKVAEGRAPFPKAMKPLVVTSSCFKMSLFTFTPTVSQPRRTGSTLETFRSEWRNQEWLLKVASLIYSISWASR